MHNNQTSGDAYDMRVRTRMSTTQAPNLSQSAYETLLLATAPVRLNGTHGTYDIGRENAKAELRDIIEALNNGHNS